MNGIAPTTVPDEFEAGPPGVGTATSLGSVVCIGRTAVSAEKVDDDVALVPGVSVTVVMTVNFLVSVVADTTMTR